MSTTAARAVESYVVQGPARLRGEVRVSGAKNSALKLFAASLLTDEPVVIGNVPKIADIPVMADILRGLGCDVTMSADRREARIVASDPAWHAPADAVSRIRASISLLGPMVARCGRARLALPGGDQIGARAIDLHVRGLMAMGAQVEQAGNEIEVLAPNLHGAEITLDFPSVGATENLVMAALAADGRTVLDNAAREPEIQDLCGMLVAMGASIEGIGTPTIAIEGGHRLGGVTWQTCPDRIEAGTWLMAAAATGGDVTVTHVNPAELKLPLMKLEAAGIALEVGVDRIRASGSPTQPTDFVTLPYPGFPTDLQPQMMVVLTQAPGVSMCTENVFESRYAFVDQLRRLGADVTIDGHHAIVQGRAPMQGARLDALDVRAGAAGVLAGLVSDGETTVVDVHHIDRGYTDFVDNLTSLGASVVRQSTVALA
ncbi:MAG: UDP-N-acetylglucosamine 1-carboxyvinyltransferase [Glaciecola sp.]|jgi:UDP-N-acetylglucosamine 1-carboxyvinyltransferase